MAGETIGKAYLQVMPEVKDFGSNLKSQVSGEISSAGQDSGRSFGDSFKSAILAAGVGIAIKKMADGITDMVKSSIAAFTDLESSTAKVATIMDTSVMTIEDMQSGIISLSNQMGVSTSELSDTVYNAISATGDTANALNLAETAAKLASAGFTDTGSALSVLTTAMNAYGISASEAESISDSLITVQNLGVTTVAELSASMGKAIASASAYGIDLANLESAYISLTKSGISTAESTTYMSSMFKELGKSGSDVSGILVKQTGKSFGELMEDGSSLADVLGILYDAVEGDSTALMNLWGSAEAGKAANAIINQGLTEFNNNLNTIKDSSGSTADAFAIMEDTLETKMAKLGTAWTNLLAGMASGSDVSALTDNLINQFDSVVESVIPIIGNIADALPALFTTIAQRLPELLGTVLPSLIDACVQLVTNLVANIPTLLQPIIAGIPSFVSSMLDGLTACLPQLLTGIGSLIGKLVSELPSMLANLVTSIPDILLGLVEGIGGGIRSIIETVTGDTSWSDMMNRINEGIEGMAQANESLANTISKVGTAYYQNVEATEADAYAAESLTNKLFELIAANDGAAQSNREIQTVVEMLNKSVPGLGLAYDATTNSVNLNSEAIYQHINALKLEAKEEAAKQFYVDALTNEYEARRILNEAQAEGARLAAELGVSEQTYLDILSDGVITEAERGRLREETNSSIIGSKALEEELMEIYKGESEALENLERSENQVAYADEMLDKAVEELTSSMLEQADAAYETGTAIDKGLVKGVTEGIPEINESVDQVEQAMTPEVPSDIYDTGVAVDEELSKGINDANGEIITAIDDVEQIMTDGVSEVPGEMLETGSDAGNQMDAGITSTLSNIQGTLRTMASYFQTEMLHVGDDLMSRGKLALMMLAAGITESTQGNVVPAIQNTVQSVTGALNSLPSELQSIGNNAGAGLYNGLNAWSSSLYNLAWSIANSINQAARSALQIHSPSAVLEDTGQFTVEGLAVGIEKNADKAIDAISDVAEDIITESGEIVDQVNSNAMSAVTSGNNDFEIRNRIRGSVDAQMSGHTDDQETVITYLGAIIEAVNKLANMKLVTNTGVLAGELAPALNREFATMAVMEGRL